MEKPPRYVTLRDGTVPVELLGSGPSVLLLHGLSAHRQVWAPVLRPLRARFTLCLPDLLSRGESEARPEASYRLSRELERIRELLARCELAPLILVGHSQGAALAAALAAEEHGVAGLVLANPVTPWTHRPRLLRILGRPATRRVLAGLLVPARRPLARHLLRRAYGPGTRPTRVTVERFAGPYRSPRRATTLLRALAEWHPAELAGRLPTRSLAGRVLAGDRDRRIGVEAPGRLAARLGLRFEVLRGAGHVIPQERPEAIARAVEETYREILEGRRERTTG
ncbi:MAG: alpha/beta fold hydrolase [Gemmatimonadota bacterium]